MWLQPLYLLCLFSDCHIFNYHNHGHPTSLAFLLFWVFHYSMYCLFIYSYILVNSVCCFGTRNKLLLLVIELNKQPNKDTCKRWLKDCTSAPLNYYITEKWWHPNSGWFFSFLFSTASTFVSSWPETSAAERRDIQLYILLLRKSKLEKFQVKSWCSKMA